MTLEKRKEKLKMELLKAKAEGLRVFITDSNYYAYGIMTDGTNVIYVECPYYGTGFTTCFEYVPSRGCGSGCPTLKSGYEYKELSKEIFLEAVHDGKVLAWKYGATLYQNFEQYFNTYRQEHYIEL